MLFHKKILAATLALSLLLGATAANAAQPPIMPQAAIGTAATARSPWQNTLAAKLNAAMSSELLQKTQAGVMVYDLTTNTTIFQSSARQLMRPASTLKLLTAIAALDRLGAGYQFTTRLAYTGAISNGTLQGDLYCIGGFDPCFNTADMQALVSSLQALGIRNISGRIVADKSMINAPRWGEGWCWDDEKYNPTLSPLLLNESDNFMPVFKQLLQSANIQATPYISYGEAPAAATLISQRSHSIQQVLRKMLKDSDNLYAEAMFYNLAASGGSRHATASQSKAHINSLIQRIGLQPADYRLADGSGLSVYNYLSPELETAFLKYAYQHQEIFAQLYPSLPIGATDGTLDFRQGNIPGRVHAKTGSLTGVNTLAGYATAANGHLLAFSIMNEGVLSAAAARAFQDNLCTILCTAQ